MIELRGVSRQFGPPGEPVVTVLSGIDLTVNDGESVAVVGPSGSGKSTLLNLMGGLDRPDSGGILLDGRDLAGLTDRELATVRNRDIGFIFQLHHLLPQCSALENVLVPTLAGGERPGRGELETRARELLERVGLSQRVDAFPATLSGGERQRVAVARALVNGPRLLLADEPTGALDADSATALSDLLADLNHKDGTTLVVVTHSQALADSMGRCLVLRNGRLNAASEAGQ